MDTTIPPADENKPDGSECVHSPDGPVDTPKTYDEDAKEDAIEEAKEDAKVEAKEEAFPVICTENVTSY